MIKYTRKLTATIIGSILYFLPITVFAGALDNAVTRFNTVSDTAGLISGDLPTIIGKYISALLGILGIILVVIIIYAGFQWMTAQGDVEKVKTAKKMITQAVFGMAIILSAYAITTFVVSRLAG